MHGYQAFGSKDELWRETLADFFHTIVNDFFCRMDDQAMHDKWHQGSGSTSSAGGRRSNPNSSSAPSIPYRGQRAVFPPECFAPQQSGSSHSQRARGRNGSRGRGELGQGSGTSSGVQAPTEVGQLPSPYLVDWTLQDPPRPSNTIERRGTRRSAES